MLIKSVFDPVFCFGLVFFSPCVPLLILFYLIDVHWGRLSLCGDHCVVWRRLNVYMHSFDFTQGSTGPSPGCSGSLSHMLSFLKKNFFNTTGLKVRPPGLGGWLGNTNALCGWILSSWWVAEHVC